MKVLIAPHDIAGQMGILARSLRSIGTEAWSINFGSKTGYLRFDLDETLDLGDESGRFRQTARAAYRTQQLLREYSVIHYFFGRSMLPRLSDARVAHALGKTVLVHFRGSDVTTIDRRISGSAAYLPPGAQLPIRSGEHQIKLIRKWRSVADVLLISTPDLWREVPGALLVPQAIELERWPRSPLPRRTGNCVRVGHAPTNQGVKGTPDVERAVESLQRKGVDVELDLITGVPPGEVRARMERCHIAIDQVVQGAYGNVTLQFMALGRPTMNFLDPIYDQRGIDVPTVKTTPQTLEADLLELVSSSTLELTRIGDRARDYVENTHDGKVIAATLAELYESVSAKKR